MGPGTAPSIRGTGSQPTRGVPVTQRMSSPRTPGAAGRLVVRVGPADVGRRVTVRYRPDRASATLTDVVGVLDSWSGGRGGALAVRRRDGRLQPVPATAVVAARVVAPEVSAEQMQRIAQDGWPPPESHALGEWQLRWAGGGTGRANSVRVAGTPGVPLEDALAVVARWYADRGGPPRLQVPSPSLDDEAFDALGWPEVRRTYVLVAPVADLLEATADGRARTDLVRTVDAAPSREWLAAVGDRDTADDDLLRRVLTAPAQVGFATVRSGDGDGGLLGIGRVSRSGDWAGITSVETRPAARRRGIGTAVMGALAAWASDHGAGHTYLQVFADNETALAWYARLGYTRHHTYVYRAPAIPTA